MLFDRPVRQPVPLATERRRPCATVRLRLPSVTVLVFWAYARPVGTGILRAMRDTWASVP
jgi:hypothetical protein